MPSASVSSTTSRNVLLPEQPVRVDIPAPPTPPTIRITTIVPCHNRPEDARLLLEDLARIRDPRIHLHTLLVDNASDVPLSDLAAPEGLSLEHLRLNQNTGGSGGFNAGLARAAEDPTRAEYLLLIDSDARLPENTLTLLLDVLESDRSLLAAGPALADPLTGRVFECGGHLNRRTGAMEPMVPGVAGVAGVAVRTGEQAPASIACDYLAACCALVRTPAAVAAGPFPDTFLNADDAEWFIRMGQIACGGNGRIVAVPEARAFHPRFDRFPTWTRYYSTRNAHGPIAAIGGTRRTHLKRAFRDAARAAALELADQRRLASLHLRGLSDAARGRTRGPAPTMSAPAGGAGAPPVSLRGSFGGRALFRPIPLARASAALARGTISSLRIAARSRPSPSRLNPAVLAAHAREHGAARGLSVEAVVLSYNRWAALEQTITSLLTSPAFTASDDRPAQRTITIIDNGSTDGTPDRVEAFLLPGNESRLRLIRLDANLGVEAFNRAVLRSTAEAVLILDDDATPDPDSLDAALELLARTPSIAAIPLHPIHPKSGESEWPFASHSSLPTSHFPLLGCANLIRRAAWNAVGGYESAFFLYRNDADLALKLLDAGLGVHFDPALFAHHDTPAGPGVAKSVRWHELATRNWIWMARRHGRGLWLAVGIVLNVLWAHKLAGLSPTRHLATLRGVVQGLRRPAPAAPPSDGRAWRTLIRLHLSRL